MAGFFKSFGKGILYCLFLPFVIAILAIYAIFGLLILVVLFLKNIILFFRGKSIFSDLEEDTQAKAIIDANKAAAQQILANQLNPAIPVSNTTNTTNTTNNIFIVAPTDLNGVQNAEQLLKKVQAIDNQNDTVLIENNSGDIKMIENGPTNDVVEEIDSEEENIVLKRDGSENAESHHHTFETDSTIIKDPLEAKTNELPKPKQTADAIDIGIGYYEPKQGHFDQEDDFEEDGEESDGNNGVSISSFKERSKK